MSGYPISNVSSQVKLVVWDLDETFWRGTLSEGGITPIAHNVEMIRSFVDRGIMCSICSKNDREAAAAALRELGVLDLFILPHIDWTPKGQVIKNMIEALGLRPENVVFLDDNHLNLEETAFFNPGIMCVDGRLDMRPLLESPHCSGKDDREHSRLKQYKVIEQRLSEMGSSALSNEEFLRQSDIQIRIITDIDSEMDRVLELINRTNQLNFTKVRANTPQEREKLDDLLGTSGVHAGLVHVRDRFGDYGIVGFFCVRTKYSGTTVFHFAFSCRTLNMGVEQWVWEYLGCPEFKIAGPVANPLKSFDKVDWITQVESFDGADAAPDRRLCLVGGCDLLQVSFYCGNNRDEFVNKEDSGFLVRYDDIGFFLNDRAALKHERTLMKMPGWSYQDAVRLDESLEHSDIILLSLYFSIPTDNLFTFGGKQFGGEHYFTVPVRTLKKLMKTDLALWFAKAFFHRRLELKDRLALTEQCFAKAVRLARPEARIFILSAAMEHGQQAERTRRFREPYNAMCRDFCERNPASTVFVDIDRLLSPEDFVDSDHYTRTGYFKIAEFVNSSWASEAAADHAPVVAAAN